MDSLDQKGVTKIFSLDEDHDISFWNKDRVEIIRLCENGDFIVKGKKIANDLELYHAMREFFHLPPLGG